MTTLDYKKLLNGVKTFEKENPSNTPSEQIYMNSITPNYIDWTNLQNDSAKKVFKFLNVWGCRMKCKPQDLIARYQEVAPLFSKLSNLKLEDVNLDQLIKCNSETLTLQRSMHSVFDSLSNIKGYGPVPASKTLHIACPSLLVMWDNSICFEVYEKLNMKLNGYSYAYIFMPRMKQKLEEAIDSCMKAKGLSRIDAIQWLLSEIEKTHKTSRSLAKALDEYNWLKGKHIL
ncbi:MAG: hypothetical protein ABR909_07900 [Candidatus Bathyarchaeia archaeon]|jgi:hypothetical protein